MQNKFMKSQKGLTLVELVVMIIVLMILAGVSTYVVLNENEGKEITNQNNTNEVQVEDV